MKFVIDSDKILVTFSSHKICGEFGRMLRVGECVNVDEDAMKLFFDCPL